MKKVGNAYSGISHVQCIPAPSDFLGKFWYLLPWLFIALMYTSFCIPSAPEQDVVQFPFLHSSDVNESKIKLEIFDAYFI